jgi:hypothetical protein
MTEPNAVYHKVERKQKLVDDLQKLLDIQLANADILDNKAWEILKVTSGTVGLVSALEITLTKGIVGQSFWFGLAAVLVFYVLQIVVLMRAVQPRQWPTVPGGEGGDLHYDILMERYVLPDDNDYLNQLIADYVGIKDSDLPTDHSNNKSKFHLFKTSHFWHSLCKNREELEKDKSLPGVIQKAQALNNEKAACLRVAAKLLGFIVIGLSIMAVLAVM